MANEPTILCVDGECRTVSEWARKLGIHPAAIRKRKRSGKSDKEALGMVGEKERMEDVCLTCRLPANRCKGGDVNCPYGIAYPSKMNWRASVTKGYCGIPDEWVES